MLKKMCLTAVLIFAALLLSSCFEVTTEITLNKDGSGILLQKVMFSEMLISQMESMSGDMGMEGESSTNSMYDEDKLKAEASKYGEGIVFSSGSEISNGGKKGYEAYYNFSDIRNLRIGNDPSSVIDMGGDMNGGSEDLIKFDFKKGKTAHLTILMPEEEAEAPDASSSAPETMPNGKTTPDAEMDEASMAMMKQLFSGMKFSYKIKVEGTITETDADNADGSTVTIMEMDFDKIMENPEGFKNLENIQGENSDAAVKAMKDLEGVKIDLKDRITVKFK